jgi:CRISPR-associated protein Csb2
MFALEIEYLLGRAVATNVSRRDEAEWPPHPARLFSALVDALADIQHDSTALYGKCEEALRWLEAQDAPEIAASLDDDVSVRDPVKYWVPINDEVAEKVRPAPLGDQRKRQERYFPAVVPAMPRVVFVWPSAVLDDSLGGAIETLVQRVPYLGHSSSLVRIARSLCPPARSIAPSSAGRYLLRIPGVGRLARLQGVHELRRVDTMVQPPRGREVRYAPTRRVLPQGPHGTGSVVAIAGFPIGLENQALVVSRYRAALLSLLGREIPPALSGHAPGGGPAQQPHIAFIPLANVGHQYADGLLKGLAVVLPRDLDDDHLLRLEAAMGKLRTLHFGARGSLDVRTIGVSPEMKTLDFLRYRKAAATWVTVTPVALGSHPKPKKGLTEEACFSKELARLGLPEPAEVVLQNVSFVRGAPRASEVSRQAVSAASGRLLRHAYVRFSTPVEGPLLVGAGRHMGFGLFLPQDVA